MRSNCVDALVRLMPHLPEPLKQEAVQEALAAVEEIREGGDRSLALRALAHHLPVASLGAALAIAREIRGDRSRMQALAGLAPHLPQGLLAEALAAAQAIGDTFSRAKALAPQRSSSRSLGGRLFTCLLFQNYGQIDHKSAFAEQGKITEMAHGRRTILLNPACWVR